MESVKDQRGSAIAWIGGRYSYPGSVTDLGVRFHIYSENPGAGGGGGEGGRGKKGVSEFVLFCN